MAYYLSPDNLQWEPLDISYSEFIVFCFSGNLEKFYNDLKWKSWKKDVALITGEQAINFFPFLWTQEGGIETSSKKVISIEELYFLKQDIRKQLGY